jgi:hypothetical protein
LASVEGTSFASSFRFIFLFLDRKEYYVPRLHLGRVSLHSENLQSGEKFRGSISYCPHLVRLSARVTGLGLALEVYHLLWTINN